MKTLQMTARVPAFETQLHIYTYLTYVRFKACDFASISQFPQRENFISAWLRYESILLSHEKI